MRTLLAVVIPALMITAATAPAQQKKAGSRASRNASTWAVAYQDPNIANAPPIAPLPQAVPPTVPPGRAATLSAPVAHPGGCTAGCGANQCHEDGHKCCKLLDWFCYRRSASCAKGCGCCYWCCPPLYSYFGCHCREGARHDTHVPKPCPPSGCGSCGWGKFWSSGTQMFASPTAQGVVGVR